MIGFLKSGNIYLRIFIFANLSKGLYMYGDGNMNTVWWESFIKVKDKIEENEHIVSL